MDPTVSPPTIPVPFPLQFPYNVSRRAVAMVNFGRFDVPNVEKPNRHTEACSTETVMHSNPGLSTGAAHSQVSQPPLDPFNNFRFTLRVLKLRNIEFRLA